MTAKKLFTSGILFYMSLLLFVWWDNGIVIDFALWASGMIAGLGFATLLNKWRDK